MSRLRVGALLDEGQDKIAPAGHVAEGAVSRSPAADFAQHRQIGGDDGRAARHRFGDRQPEAFTLGRHHDHRGTAIQRRQLHRVHERE